MSFAIGSFGARFGGRAPWLFLIGAIAGAGIAHARHHHRHHRRCSGPACEYVRGPDHELHVELGPTHDRAELRAELRVLGARDAAIEPLFPGDPDPTLARWFEVRTPGDADATADALRASGVAMEAFAPPEVSLAAIDPGSGAISASCPVKTPAYDELQGYLGAAPGGIDAIATWSLPGGRGQGVRFADIEGGWNVRHEDLPGDRIELAAGPMIDDRSWQAHGTAVVGEVAGRDNGLGMTGIAPDVERIIVSAIGRNEVATAIDRAAQRLRAGDVLLIELQGAGPERKWIPVEYWRDVYDAIRVATDRGVVVVEAAGNGAADLDSRAYHGAFNPETRDSGAIVVGAGGPPRAGFTDRARLDFSNYGRRVNVQGWGRKVATLDYGDLQRCGDGVDRHYTGEFSGTSSASPIVAGAAVLVQSYAKQQGRTLTPSEVRDVLRATGTPQTSDPKQQIGPRPDLARALPALR